MLIAIDGVSFDDCYQRRHSVSIAGTELSLIALDDLRANKRAAGRPKDIADLHDLEEPDPVA